MGVSLPERGGGVTLKGGETDDLLPMNPEGVEADVSQGGHMSINDYVRRTPFLRRLEMETDAKRDEDYNR